LVKSNFFTAANVKTLTQMNLLLREIIFCKSLETELLTSEWNKPKTKIVRPFYTEIDEKGERVQRKASD
jgi:hypothetical protein